VIVLGRSLLDADTPREFAIPVVPALIVLGPTLVRTRSIDRRLA
jgi:hypothetical protein